LTLLQHWWHQCSMLQSANIPPLTHPILHTFSHHKNWFIGFSKKLIQQV
jgi:hypothetical protein